MHATRPRVIMKQLCCSFASGTWHIERNQQHTQVSISASGCVSVGSIIAANIYPDIGSNMFLFERVNMCVVRPPLKCHSTQGYALARATSTFAFAFR